MIYVSERGSGVTVRRQAVGTRIFLCFSEECWATSRVGDWQAFAILRQVWRESIYDGIKPGTETTFLLLL